MAENGNRGPNDFRARAGKRRREPPIIDASATEVPADAQDPAVPDPADADPADSVPSSSVEGDRTTEPDSSEPVLFGSAKREPGVRPEGAVPPTGAPSDPVSDLPVTATPDSVAPADRPMGLPSGERPSSEAGSNRGPGQPETPAAAFGSRGRADAAPVPPPAALAASAGGIAPWLLGLASLVLLGALAWVLYTGPERSGRDEIAALRGKVAALEARPDPAQVQAGLAALDKRVAAAEADRAGLAKSLAELTTRLDGVAQQVRPEAEKPAEPAPSGDAAAATVGALGALAAKLDGLDGRLSDVAAAQGQTAAAVANLPKPVAPDFGPIDAKVTALGGQVAALETKLNGSDARLNAFDAKVNAVDSKVNGFDARMNAFENRTNGIDVKTNETASGLAQLQATVANLPHIDIAPLQAATAALDGRLGKVEGQLAAPKDGQRLTEARAVGSADETRATPIALVGQAVVGAIADGRPYGADLAALQALGADPAATARLAPLAEAGAPTVAALEQRWAAVRGKVLAAVKPAETGSAFDRFAANARALVQVRRVGEVQGDDPAALVSQVDAALEAGDVPAALAAWSKLPQAGQDASRDWAAAARGRVDALEAAQDVVARAIATLGRTKS